MKFQKRLLALLLCALLCGGMLSCASGETNGEADGSGDTSPEAGTSAETQETEPEETERPKAEDTLTVKDFEGRDYRMISTNQDSRQVDICADEMTGATLNDLVYGRNIRVAEMYNVNMIAEEADYSSINNMVKTDAASGDTSYELYLTNYTAHPLGTGGYLYNFYDLPAVDLTKEWWDQNEVADMTSQGRLYLAIGDISPTELLTSECMLFNKNLFDDNGITYPYEDALNGTWTLDKFIAIADGKTTDLNGDGEIKVDDDLFSLTCWNDYGTALLYGAGGDFSTFDDDGNMVLTIDQEKAVNIYMKIYAAVNGTGANYELSQHERSFKVFEEGRAYFCGITFQKIETFLREMEYDYGVLPNPKYDETQANYSTCVSGAGSMVVVPKSCTDPEYVGTMLEAMAAVSYDMITPDLIDVLASTKNVRDPQSSEIVQMIIRNRNFDTARMHDIAVDQYVATLLPQDSTDVVSYFAKQEKVWSKLVEKLNENYAKSVEAP
ncbi:MAG: hypothetical protein ACI4V1_05745 [Eubacteriales bacterium]